MVGKIALGLMYAVILFPIGLSKHNSSRRAQTPPTEPACKKCLQIRIGAPQVVRGPVGDSIDSRFTIIPLPDGRFRGFTANGDTFAIDGKHPTDMGGPLRKVLRRGAANSYASCGQWLQHVEPAGKTVVGSVHNETACRYETGQTHKSTSLVISSDYGLTWKNLGLILTGKDGPEANKSTGEGDCTFLNGQDGYYYAYCDRLADDSLIVARAPVSDPVPGKWMNFYRGKWDQPGLGGEATSLGDDLGTSAARWKTTGETLLLGYVPGGMGLFFSSDRTTFGALREPLLPLGESIWKRPHPSELIAYPVLLDAKTGGNQLSDSWMLVYCYVQPNEGFDKRYLVFRSVDVSVGKAAITPQVGVQLARWYNAKLRDRWSTTAAIPPAKGVSYRPESKSGYLMTMPDATAPSVELEDCVSQRAGHPDHLLAVKGFCEAHQYQRLRTAGWVYSSAREHTVPLYQCYDAQEHSHFASNQADCEKLGTKEHLLGYALSQ